MRSIFFSLFAALALTSPALGQGPKAPARPIDFNRDVRPILAGKCFQCHGPDDKVRKAGLRLDVRDGALKTLRSGVAAIVPGQPAKSELIARITSDQPSVVMPPPRTGKALTANEIATLKKWA